MKKSFQFAAIFAAMLGMLFVSCKPEPKPEDVTIEAVIKTIQIVNAGISGGDKVNGEIDATTKTITFNDVAAETNITAIKFQATVSLGAKLEKDTYDFTEGNDPTSKTLTADIKCVNEFKNVVKEETYKAIVNLNDPASAPVIEKIVIKDDKGTEKTVNSSNILDGLLCLGVPESSTAEVVSVELSPARATYEFTTAANGVISASNPGYFKMDFMGLTAEYEVTFSASPTPGADFAQAKIHDFSLAAGNVYPDFAEEFTRGGDFDGQYVLLANRTAPKLFAVSDLLQDNTGNPIMLDLTGVEGGTHVVSAGRLAQGHIYLCNLATAPADSTHTNGPLKVYHYATPTSKPEVVLTFDGSGIADIDYTYTSRIGDNISIDIDESGNGYAFFFKQEEDEKFVRFTITNFTQFSNPKVFSLPAISSYYGMMNRVGPNQYLFTSSYATSMWMLSADAANLFEISWEKTANGVSVTHACDPRVIEFNRSRYLMMTNARRFAWWASEALHVFDISEGNDIVSALAKLKEAQYAGEEEASIVETVFDVPLYNSEWDESGLSQACSALCNTAEVDGKLLIWAAAPHVGMVLVEVPKMK